MRTLEIARRLIQLGETKEACKACYLALHESDGSDPAGEFEAAMYLLRFGGGDDYKVSYQTFCRLYNSGFCKEDILQIMDEAFRGPNVKLLQRRYRKNCALLEKYPYLFRKNFPKFENLPIRFFPYDDNSYTPYYPGEERFGDYINPGEPVIRHNFFKELEKPVLAQDIFSQYELEYLRDNVRRSEDVARENHVYLYYSSWEEFCAWLTCLDMKPLLEEKKIVFLFGEEINQYPIDFKARFGIDYSQYDVKPLRIRDINRLVWHVQLSSHNGGDLFNEVLDFHPNLLFLPSVMMENYQENIDLVRRHMDEAESLSDALRVFEPTNSPPRLVEELYHMKNRTDKDILAFLFMRDSRSSVGLDKSSRIVPALFLQPHVGNVICQLKREDGTGRTVLSGTGYDDILQWPAVRGFRYIKTFVPLRRFTTSYGATVRFVHLSTKYEIDCYLKGEREHPSIMSDIVFERVLNRTFMADPDERLYKDSVVVRFEDGKLNPKATFTALAAFLDLPYTETMTYCSEYGDQKGGGPMMEGNAAGFDPVTVYRTYDEFANDSERCFIEYFLRDAYEYYGYDFHYYDGKPMDLDQVKELMEGFDSLNNYLRQSWEMLFEVLKINIVNESTTPEEERALKQEMVDSHIKSIVETRMKNVEILMGGLQFVNRRGQPLHMIPQLRLEPELLEGPIYR